MRPNSRTSGLTVPPNPRRPPTPDGCAGIALPGRPDRASVARGSDGIVSVRDLVPAAGPPPELPLARLGPTLAGGLSGLILEDDGRLSIRLGLLVPPDDQEGPWRCPVAVRAGFRWEPARAATMTPNTLALQWRTPFFR